MTEPIDLQLDALEDTFEELKKLRDANFRDDSLTISCFLTIITKLCDELDEIKQNNL